MFGKELHVFTVIMRIILTYVYTDTLMSQEAEPWGFVNCVINMTNEPGFFLCWNVDFMLNSE